MITGLSYLLCKISLPSLSYSLSLFLSSLNLIISYLANTVALNGSVSGEGPIEREGPIAWINPKTIPYNLHKFYFCKYRSFLIKFWSKYKGKCYIGSLLDPDNPKTLVNYYILHLFFPYIALSYE